MRRNLDSNPTDLIVNLYKDSFARVASSLQYQDKIVLALVLTTAYYVESIGDIFKSAFIRMLETIIADVDFEKSVGQILDMCLARKEDGWNMENIIELNQDNLTLQILSKLMLLLATGDVAQNQRLLILLVRLLLFCLKRILLHILHLMTYHIG